LIKPLLRQHPINKALDIKADRADSQVVARAADWLRVACACATGNTGERRAFEANEEVAEIKRRVGTETKETETAHNRL
jgi:hypothetical protein